MKSNPYLIGDLAVKTGIPTVTINYYLRIGLISEVSRSEFSNYRYFDDSTVRLLMNIRKLRLDHISLKEIKKRIHDGIL